MANIEVHEFCILNRVTGEIQFSDKKNNHKFTGLYFKDERTFFAIYPTESGPNIYYRGKEFLVHKNLSVSLKKMGKSRKFYIDDYKIEIEYKESEYLGLDPWSEEMDIDLFYMIEQRHKADEFYKQYSMIQN